MRPGLALAVLLLGTLSRAGDGRLLTLDAAETLPQPVLGLQRSAIPLAWGVALDTSLLGDVALAPNLGQRWAKELRAHRLVVGLRYTTFVGAPLFEGLAQAQLPQVKIVRFSPAFGGPSVNVVYGFVTGAWLLELEAHCAHTPGNLVSTTLGAALTLVPRWEAVLEAGVRILGGPVPRAAAGVRYRGEHLGVTLGVSWAGARDALLPGGLPVLPVVDASWSFG